MKTNLTKPPRKFYQFEVDESFKAKLNDLAKLDGISASGVIRMLVLREYAARLNGHTPPADPCQDKEEKG